MFGSGRKKLRIRRALELFLDEMREPVRASLPALRDAIDAWGGNSERVDEEKLYSEVYPAVIAIGLAQVPIIWSRDTWLRSVKKLFDVIDFYYTIWHGRKDLADKVLTQIKQYSFLWYGAAADGGSTCRWTKWPVPSSPISAWHV